MSRLVRAGAIGASRGAAALLAMLAVAGCASTSGLAPRAVLRTPDELSAARALQAATVSAEQWPSDAWWRAFGDPQLDRLIDAALRGSPTLAIAEARTRAALAAAGVADAERYPAIDASARSNRELFPGHALIPPPYAGRWNTTNELQASLSWDLDLWGRNRAQYERTIGEARAAGLDAAAARLSLAANIAHAYVHLEREYLQLDVGHQLLEERAQIYKLTQQRDLAGIDSQLELKQAESAVPAAHEQITQLNADIALTRDALAALIGDGPDRGLEIVRPEIEAMPDLALPSRVPAELLGRRPDILALRWRIEAARHGIAAAKAQFYPDVSLTALVGLEALGTGAFATAANREIGAQPALTLPIFDAGRRRAALSARDAEYDAAVDQYNQALADALRQVVDQIVTFKGDMEQRGEQREALETAQDAYGLALSRYQDGIGNYLQVLATHTAVLAQRSLDADLRARALDVQIDLARALGGGFRPNGAQMPARQAEPNSIDSEESRQ